MYFAGGTLGYVDVQTGEQVKVQIFVSIMESTDYTFAICVRSHQTEDFLHALAKPRHWSSMEALPRIIVFDNLKAAVVKANRYNPVQNKAMDDIGHYGFVTIACKPERLTH